MKLDRTPKARRERINRTLYLYVSASFLIPVVFLLIRMVMGGVPENAEGYHSAADYALMIVQCLLGLAVINIPRLLARQFRFRLPMVLYSMYILFLYCAIFLGEVRSFYYLVPRWDSILHGFSSLMLGFFGFMVITILNRDEHVLMDLSPLFAAVFAFCFSVTIGAIWEIYEFVFDGILGLNMQKFMTAEGVILSGHAALADTMKDIIVDALGAFAASVIGHFAVKHDRSWMKPELIEGDEGSKQSR